MTCPPGKPRIRYVDDEQRGLYVTIGRRTKVWEVKLLNRWVRIGEFPRWSCKAARKEASKRRGEDDGSGPLRLTLRDAYERWKSSRVQRSALTVQSYAGIYKKHFADWHGKQLEKITPGMLSARYEDITEKSGAGAARNALICFQACWREARKLHPKLPPCPSGAIQHHPKPKRDAKAFYAALPEWRQAIEASPYRDFWLFALLTGMRRQTLLEAEWGHISAGTLTVPRPKRERGKDYRPYDLPLLDAHMEVIERVRRPGVRLLFPDAAGAAPPAGWKGPHFTPHTLRHCFMSAGAEAGVHPYLLCLLMNHAIPGMAGTYVARNADIRDAMAATVSRLLLRTGLG